MFDRGHMYGLDTLFRVSNPISVPGNAPVVLPLCMTSMTTGSAVTGYNNPARKWGQYGRGSYCSGERVERGYDCC